MGAEVVQGNLTVPSSLPEVVRGAWGVFAVTDFYDKVCTRVPWVDLCLADPSNLQAVIDNALSEEEQGRSLAKAAADAGVQCFLWSTLPSSYEISGGRFVTQLYEGMLGKLVNEALRGLVMNKIYRKALC